MSDKVLSKKIAITMKEDVLERVDEYADANGMTRSGLLQLAVVQYLNAVEAAPSINKMFSAMADVLDGTLRGDLQPHEAQAKVDGIQTAYDLLYNKK